MIDTLVIIAILIVILYLIFRPTKPQEGGVSSADDSNWRSDDDRDRAEYEYERDHRNDPCCGRGQGPYYC